MVHTYIWIKKEFQLKSRLLNNIKLSVSGWPTPSPGLCYRPEIFFCQLSLTGLSIPQWKFGWCFKNVIACIFTAFMFQKHTFSLILVPNAPSHFLLVGKEKLIIIIGFRIFYITFLYMIAHCTRRWRNLLWNVHFTLSLCVIDRNMFE